MHIGVHRSQQQGYGHRLQLFMSRKVRKEVKPHGENPPPGKEKAQNLKMSSICIYLHLNELNELLQVKYFDEEIVNSTIMC